jgi:hypothetical protein
MAALHAFEDKTRKLAGLRKDTTSNMAMDEKA